MASLLSSKYLSQSIGNEVVTLYIGKDKTSFIIHKSLLRRASGVFNKAFTTGFKEAVQGTMTLPEDLPEHFEVFIEWLYRGATFKLDVMAIWMDREGGKSAWDLEDLVMLYLFAEKYCCPGLQNLAMDAIQDGMDIIGHHSCGPDWVAEIFERTAHNPSTPLRAFCAAEIYRQAIYSEWWDVEETTSLFKKVPEALTPYLKFLQMISRGVIGEDEDPEVRRGNGESGYHLCFFHHHDRYNTEEDCSSTPNR